jgi:putative ATPase
MQTTLFGDTKNLAPLAHRVRPTNITQFVGQTHLRREKNEVGNDILENLIREGSNISTIIYGPPGCGKTTLAGLIARESKQEIISVNGAQCSVNDIRKTIETGERNLEVGLKTILFIDEIHRFNKAQQDSLLEPVEKGYFRLLGATTENPFFGVSSPLISRCLLIELKGLSTTEISKILQEALKSELKELEIDQECLDYISNRSNGDARIALNALEMAYNIAEPIVGQKRKVELDEVRDLLSKNITHYDKKGNNHYDQISAFIKSMRGSDPDASLYWLARMIYSGEDPLYIARRLVIHAAEDVGLADPSAIQSAIAAQKAVETIGLPEAKIPLAMATLHIALAPKSNSSCLGIKRAMDFIENSKDALGPVPPHLKDSHYNGAETLGSGLGYMFPHSYEGGYVEQNYLPENLKNKKLGLYECTKVGYENRLHSNLVERVKSSNKANEQDLSKKDTS